MEKILSTILTWLRKSLFVILKRFFCFLVVKFIEWGGAVLDLIFPYMPDGTVEGVLAFSSWLGSASAYFPVGTAIATISSVLAVYVGCMAIRIIRRFLPF